MHISVLQAILLFVFGLGVNMSVFPLGWLSMNIMNKPLIVCAIIGLICGDIKNAMLIGCVIQAAYIGQMTIGGVTTLPNINLSLWFALPLTLASGGDSTTCLTVCLAFVPVFTLIQTGMNLFKIGFMHAQDRLVEEGKIKKAVWYPWLGHLSTAAACLLIPILVLSGEGVISSLVAMVPSWLNGALNTFIGLLPSIGFMVLMLSMVSSKLQWIWFILGFVLSKHLGWSTMSITVLGLGIAYLIFMFTPAKTALVTESAGHEEDYD